MGDVFSQLAGSMNQQAPQGTNSGSTANPSTAPPGGDIFTQLASGTVQGGYGSPQDHPSMVGPMISADTNENLHAEDVSSDPFARAGLKIATPFAKKVMDAVDKLREIENFTPEGRQEHPIQAHLGDVANRLEGFLFGNQEHGEAAIGSGKYGMLTNPALAATAGPEAGEGAVNAVREGIQTLRGARAGGEAVAESAEAPNWIKQAVQGEKVAQKPARAAMSEAAGEGKTPGMRSMMDRNIAESGKAERAAYDTLKEKTGVDLKDLYDYRNKIQDAIDNPANIDREDLLQDKLKDVEARIAHAESDATRNLVNAPEKLKEAEGLTQKRYAQEELKKRLFNNESVVSGNVEHGAEESIDVDAAIREVEKLNKPSRYAPEGSPSRLEQALGKDGAKKLLDGLYDAKKTGKTALRKQQIAKWVVGVTGAGALGGGAANLLMH